MRQETATVKEQKLWKQIQELKQEQEEKPELKQKIEQLECELSAIQGKDINAIEAENITLRKKALNFEKELQELRKRYSELRKIFGSLEPNSQTRDNESELLKETKLAKLLLRKYSNAINEKEAKTVGEIKSLINKEDLTIQAIIQDLKPENYKLEEHYMQTAEKVLNYLTEEIQYTKADFGINFWLEPKEILEAGISDDEDLAVLLCNLLYALGDEKAEVAITELDNLTTHAIVITEFKEKTYFLDPSQKSSFAKYSGNAEKVLKEFEFKGAKIRRFLYKFNSEKYEQFI